MTDLIKVYEEEREDLEKESIEYKLIGAKIEALEEIRIDINDPEPITDLDDFVQQCINVSEAKNLINPPDGDQNTDK